MSKQIKVLVSGFEPFGGASLNPSQLLVNSLEVNEIEGIDLSTVVLPVEFKRSAEMLLQKVSEVQPKVVIAFGQAEGRTAITPERIAINLADARIPDNSGDQPRNQLIDANGDDGYFSTLPIEKMVEAIKSEGYPAEISLSAGAFLCNNIFYVLQKELKDTGVRSGFVHLPLITQQSSEFPEKFTMELEDMKRAAIAAIKACVS